MEYRTLGRTGLLVSRLCLGTMNFGPKTPETACRKLMSMALDCGINFFDTADIYGWREGEGWTENIIGQWLKEDLHRRDSLILSTKVYGSMGQDPNSRGLSAYHIRRACEASLKRLQTDHVDLYQLHHVDRNIPWEEIWQALDQLVHEGKITYCGSSNFAAWHIATANQEASKRDLLGLVSEQSRYNLASRLVELEVIPCCRFYGMAFLPWSPLAGGLLAGNALQEPIGRRTSEKTCALAKQDRQRLDRFLKICAELGEEPAVVALAWLLSNPSVTAPVIGPRTADQLISSLRLFEIKLDSAALTALNEIWPAPGGEAPEAYAW